ncbi:cytochrome c oxidase assembly protein [Thaumasiovibrio subtropicus]|uniref:cytochrome c oxidase assembly protein n=1 Tax=Thaumasiovibrio subtropicus TaxID=1891207 RepID=UPI000B362927|nr:cytochrome c oxidase assembly protein [Thaumasiovibrio subtropicus]
MANDTRRSTWKLVFAALGMFGFAYALVPLYDVFCEVTGINGKTEDAPSVVSQEIDTSREVTVEFVAYTNPSLPWQFGPEVKRLTVHPGETHTIAYAAKNIGSQDAVGQAVPSVSPGLAAKHFNKIECFCFNRQPLQAGESASLPLIFYIDPELPEEISTLTLAYTLFESPSSE